MGEPLTMSAEREAEIRGGHSLPLHTAIGWLLKELDEERAAHKRAQAVQDRISKWADATFGPATAEVSFRRFDEEDAEFTLENQDPEEAADIVICLFRWAAVKGVDLLAETEKKLAKCMARDWDLNGDGTGHRKGAATKQVLGLREQLRHSKEVSTKLLAALKQGSFVMNHLGDVLNGMDCVAEIEEETGVPQDKIDAAYHAVRAAIALAERPEDLASSANTLASSDGSPADAVPSMKGTDGR